MQIARPTSIAFVLIITGLLAGTLAVIGARVDGISPWIGVVPLVAIPLIGLRSVGRRWRASRRKMPADWKRWLEERAPIYRRADAAGRLRFERDVQIVLAEGRFEAIEGVEATDELRLAVAAGAATLLHGRPTWELDLSRTFLFYPDTFDDEYLVEADSHYDGMVHPQGPVVLSARAVVDGWDHPADGSNVVLHELAHLFDFADPAALDADGVPNLLDPASADAWRRLARREMALARRGRSMLGRYAATHESEFFAVATERFFERPHQMGDRHPELFEALVAVYNIDPREEHGSVVEAEPAPEPPRQSRIARRWEK